MSKPPSNMAYGRQEQGAALIAVLLVLILILIVGVVAVRKSTTDLRVATADQMDTVLLQSSESANQKLEAVVNGSTADPLYRTVVLGSTGVLGYFINQPNNRGDEFVYCFDPRTNEYLLNTATVHRGTGTVVDNNGYCSRDGRAFKYTSDREAVVTQVNLSLPKRDNSASASDAPFANIGYGGNPTQTYSYHEFDMYTTSLIPAYGDVGSCLRNRTTDTNNSLADCLAGLPNPAPHKIIYQQAVLQESQRLQQVAP